MSASKCGPGGGFLSTEKLRDVLGAALNKTTKHIWEVHYKFCPTRNWRISVAQPDKKIAVFIGYTGIMADGASVCEKLNYLAASGWKLFRYPPASIAAPARRIDVVEQLQRALDGFFDESLDSRTLTRDLGKAGGRRFRNVKTVFDT